MLIQQVKRIMKKRIDKIAFFLSKYLLPTPFVATLLAIISNLLVAYFFFEQKLSLVLFFAFLHIFLDAIDGSIARLTHSVTKLGAFMDLFSDQLLRNLWYFGAALGGFISYNFAFGLIIARLIGLGVVMLAENTKLKGTNWLVVSGGAEFIFIFGIFFNNLILFAEISLIVNTIVILFDLLLILYFNKIRRKK